MIEFNARFGDPGVHEHHEPLQRQLERGDAARLRRRLEPADVPLREEASLVLYLVSPDYALRPGGLRVRARLAGASRRGLSRLLLVRRRRGGEDLPHGRHLARGRARNHRPHARAGACPRLAGPAPRRARAGVAPRRRRRAISRTSAGSWRAARRTPAARLSPNGTLVRAWTVVILERASNPQFVSNTYLLADGRGGPGLLHRRGRPGGAADRRRRAARARAHARAAHPPPLRPRVEVSALRARWPEPRVLVERARARAARRRGDAGRWRGRDGGAAHEQTELRRARACVPLPTPGHTAGMLSFLVSTRAGRSAPCSRATRSSRTPSAASARPATAPTPICATRSWRS